MLHDASYQYSGYRVFFRHLSICVSSPRSSRSPIEWVSPPKRARRTVRLHRFFCDQLTGDAPDRDAVLSRRHGDAVECAPVRTHEALDAIQRAERLEQVGYEGEEDSRCVHARRTCVERRGCGLGSRRVGRRVGAQEEAGMTWSPVIQTPERQTERYAPSLMTSRSACLSSGYFATGLQKFHDWPAQSSTVSAR